MERRFSTKNSIRNFKRKRKTDIPSYRYEESIIDEEIKPLKRFIGDDFDNFTDSSNSTTPLYQQKYHVDQTECESLTNGCLSSDESDCHDDYSNFSGKSRSNVNGSVSFHLKSEKIVDSIYPIQSGSRLMDRLDGDYFSGDQDTFRVDMSRFRCFTSTSSLGNSFLSSTDFKSSIGSPVFKLQSSSSSTPPKVQNQRKKQNSEDPIFNNQKKKRKLISHRSHIYKPHRHNKSVTVTHVPCKGPACTSQICCAHFCSQKCYDNQKPIGSGGNFKASIQDYESCGTQEINVTDYGLPYPDHTYCRDHKDIYFNADPNIDYPPYLDHVESIFYDEKEARIKNPIPIPNCNGDPISSNGYISQTTRRGRPKRSNVVGLLNSYIFHPSSDVIYTPFVFKESIVEADRLSNELESPEPILYALRQCSNLYKDVRSDIPKEVLYGNNSPRDNPDMFDKIKRECRDEMPSSVLDDLFDPAADDFSFK